MDIAKELSDLEQEADLCADEIENGNIEDKPTRLRAIGARIRAIIAEME